MLVQQKIGRSGDLEIWESDGMKKFTCYLHLSLHTTYSIEDKSAIVRQISCCRRCEMIILTEKMKDLSNVRPRTTLNDRSRWRENSKNLQSACLSWMERLSSLIGQRYNSFTCVKCDLSKSGGVVSSKQRDNQSTSERLINTRKLKTVNSCRTASPTRRNIVGCCSNHIA